MAISYMYILQCSDDTYYVGSTKSLTRRLAQHQDGKGGEYTSKRLPVRLMYYEEFPRIDWAFHREHQIKKWTRRKKEALIKNDELGLSVFSRKNFENLC